MDSLQVRFAGKFYGPYEIKDITVREDSEGVFNLVLDDGRTVLCTEKALIAIVSDERKDHNHLRDARFDVMIPEIIEIVKQYDLPSQDIKALIESIASEIDGRFGRAINFMWTQNDKLFVPGFSAMNDVTLLMAEEVISKIPKHDGGTEGDTATETAGN